MRGKEKDQFGLDTSLQDRINVAEFSGKRYIDKIEQKIDANVNYTVKLDPILEQLGEK